MRIRFKFIALVLSAVGLLTGPLLADPLPYPIDSFQNPGVVVPPAGSNWYWVGNPHDTQGNWNFSDSNPETFGNGNWWTNGAISPIAAGTTVILGETTSPYTSAPYTSLIRLDADRAVTTLTLKDKQFTLDLAGRQLTTTTLNLGTAGAIAPRLLVQGGGTLNLRNVAIGNGSSNNVFGGPGATFTLAGGSTLATPTPGTLIVGGANSTGNSFTVGSGQSLSFTTLAVNAANATAPSNNGVMVDGGTLTFSGAITINGGYFSSSALRSNNSLEVRNGGTVEQTGNITVNNGSRLAILGSDSRVGTEGAAGTFSAEINSEILVDGGTFRTGASTIKAGASLSVLNGGTVVLGITTVNGTFTINDSAVTTGNLTLNPTAPATGLALSGGNGVLNTGTLTVNTADITASGGAKINPTGNLTLNRKLTLNGAGSQLNVVGSWTGLLDDTTVGVSRNTGSVVLQNGAEANLSSLTFSNGTSGKTYTLPFSGGRVTVGANGIKGINVNRNLTVNIPAGTELRLSGGNFNGSNNTANGYNSAALTLSSTTVGSDLIRSVLSGSTDVENTGTPFGFQTTAVNGGKVSPGTDEEPGFLSLGTAQFSASSVLELDIFGFGEGEHDSVSFDASSSTFAPGATIKVNLRNDFEAIDGDRYPLFAFWNLPSTFNFGTPNWVLLTLPDGLAWDLSSVATDGVITVYDATATGNDTRLYLGAAAPVPADGGNALTFGFQRVIKDTVVSTSFPLNKVGNDVGEYSVEATDGATSPSAGSPQVWENGDTVQVGLDTSTVGNITAGQIRVKNLASDYSGSDPASGSRDQDDIVTVSGNVVENRTLSVLDDASFGKVLAGAQKPANTDGVVRLQGDGKLDSEGTRLTLRTGYSIPGVGFFSYAHTVGELTIQPPGTATFNGPNVIRNLSVYGTFTTSGHRDFMVNANAPAHTAGLPDPLTFVLSGEASTSPAYTDGSVQAELPMHVLADVYDHASLSVDAPANPAGFADGETIILRNAAAVPSGLRAAARLKTVTLPVGWTLTGLPVGTVLDAGASASGTLTYTGPAGINSTVALSQGFFTLAHDDTTIWGVDETTDPAPVYFKLRKVFNTQSELAFGEVRDAYVPQGQSFAGVGAASENGTTAEILDGQSAANSLFTLSFTPAPADPAVISDVFSFTNTDVPLASDVFTHWNFNGYNFDRSTPGQGSVPLSIPADGSGTGVLSLAGWTGQVEAYGQFGANLQQGESAGENLSLFNQTGNGSYIQLSFDMTGRHDLVLRYSGAEFASYDYQQNQWSWSTDGVNFTDFGPAIVHTGATLVELAAPAALNNSPTCFLRFKLNGGSSDGPNNPARYTIDNLTLSGVADPTILGPDQSVVSLSYDPADVPGGQIPELGEFTAAGWVNAITGNTGGTPNFVEGAYVSGAHTLSSYGLDTATHTVWAVVNHSGKFGVLLPQKVATLASLGLSAGGLTPSLDHYAATVTAAVPDATSNLVLTPTLTAATANLTVDTVPVASGSSTSPLALSSPDTSISLVVTAPDGTTTRTYDLIVTRTDGAIAVATVPANNLSLSAATLRGTVTSNGAPPR